MIPVALLLGLVVGRLWVLPAAALLWVLVLLPGDACDGWCLVSGGALAAANAFVGIVVHRAGLAGSSFLRRRRRLGRRGRRRRMGEGRSVVHPELRADVDAVKGYGLKRAAASFAVVNVDHAGDGEVVALFTCDQSEHDRELRRVVEHPVRLRVREAEFTMTELEALRRRVSEDREWFVRQGLRRTGVTIDVRRNRVVVAIQNPSRRTARELNARYGRGVWLDPRVVKAVLR